MHKTLIQTLLAAFCAILATAPLEEGGVMLIGMRNAMLSGGKRTPTAKDYVQDGLVAMWDGIENAGWGVHDANATVWKDLSGNGNNLTEVGQPVIGIYDSHYVLAGSSSKFLRCSISISSAKTVEGLFSIDTSQKSCLCGPSGGYNYPFIVFSEADQGLCVPLAYQGSRIKGVPVDIGAVNSVTIIHVADRTSTGFHNGEPSDVTFSSSTNIGSGFNYSSYATVGYCASMQSRIGFNGKVFSIRYYSRALTADEIAANYAVDKARFNLP